MFFNFCRVTQYELVCDTRVNFRVVHMSYILCTAQDSYVLHVLHNCKKHVSNTSCASHESVFCVLHTN